MEQLRNINELLFNIKKKLTDNEYIEFNKNLLILYKKQKEIDTKPLREAQHSLRQYYREEEQPDITNYYNSDTNSDSDVESYYDNVNNVEEWELDEE